MPRTRTGNDKPLQVYVTERDLTKLAELAQQQNTTMSEVVRRGLRDMIAATERTQTTEAPALSR